MRGCLECRVGLAGWEDKWRREKRWEDTYSVSAYLDLRVRMVGADKRGRRTSLGKDPRLPRALNRKPVDRYVTTYLGT